MATVTVQTLRAPKPTLSAKASIAARSAARKAGTETITDRRTMAGEPKKASKWRGAQSKKDNEELVAAARTLVTASKKDVRKDKSGKPKKALTFSAAVALASDAMQKQRAEAAKDAPKKGAAKKPTEGDAGATAGGDSEGDKGKPPLVKTDDKVDGGSSPKQRNG